MSPNEQIVNAFIDESRELLADLESLLLDLEGNPEDRDMLDAVFRVMHTIKGSAGMVGFDNVNHFTHLVEDSFDSIRRGEKKFDSTTADTTLLARDIVLELLEQQDALTPEIQALMEKVINQLDKPDQKKAPVRTQTVPDEELAVSTTYKIFFKPGEDIFLRGINPLNILEEVLLAGECTIVTQFDQLPLMDSFNSEKCYLYWNILLTTEKKLPELREIFLFVESESDISIETIETNGDWEEISRLGEILKKNGAINDSDLNEALSEQKKLGEVLVNNKKVSQEQLHIALKEQEHLKKQEMKTQKHTATSSIRVSTERLDKFVDLVGELVTLQAQLDQTAQRLADMELESVSERLQTLIEDLRDTALGIRMIPIGDSFNSFRRLVRDLSNQLGKSIELNIMGGDTELDKTVIDRLHDPLMHLIRNSIDHGIEQPSVRTAAGKDKTGNITLTARHAGGNVVVSIRDDGGGLNKERILEKAESKGIVTKEMKLRDEEIYKLIFNSGFSTADSVSKVSGRGVGMDVVKKEIDTLGGHISLESEEGAFTSINITLPLTLAIIDGLLVRIGQDHYVVPLASVESCLEMEDIQKEKAKDEDRDIIYYRENFLPYIKLRSFLEYPDEDVEKEQMVVIRTEEIFYGLVVDQVIGDHQTVIKNLGKLFRKTRAYSGATILGSGEVALILNISTLGRMSQKIEDNVDGN